jgi:hypothetical protein
VALTRIPPVNSTASIASGLRRTNGGVIICTGQNERGYTRLANDLFVDPVTGLGGAAFEAQLFVNNAIFSNLDT